MEKNALVSLEKRLGYTFQCPKFLELALTHPSAVLNTPSANDHYQRLEFLGDAILAAILSLSLYQQFPQEREGFLARAKSALGKGAFLAQIAKRLRLGPHIHLAQQESPDMRQHPHILEDCLEAIIGAIFLDSDFDTTRKVVEAWYGNLALQLTTSLEEENPKGTLQEKFPPEPGNVSSVRYELLGERGPAHQKRFQVGVYIKNQLYGKATGPTKKEAESEAARKALNKLKREQL